MTPTQKDANLLRVMRFENDNVKTAKSTANND